MIHPYKESIKLELPSLCNTIKLGGFSRYLIKKPQHTFWGHILNLSERLHISTLKTTS